MSYILEALRRAERERHLGQAPTVQALAQTGTAPRTQSRRSPLHLVLAALTLALAAGAAVLLWRKPAPTVVAEPAPVATSAVPAAAPAAAPAAEAAPAATPIAPQVTTAPAAAVVTPPSVPAIVPGRPLKAAVEAAAAAEVIEADEELASLDDLTTPFEGDPTIAEDSAAEADSAVGAQQPAAVPRTQPADSAATAPRGRAEAEPVLLRDMPSSYRARFPPVRLDVHVYNDDPARRWIMVEGRRYRESEALAAGPRVLAIRVEGVVFEHAGQRVLFPLSR